MEAMNTSLKALHDRMLEEKPVHAEHDTAECPFCNPQKTHENGGRMSDKTFTEDEVQALVQAKVAEATSAIQSELDDFKASQETAEVEAKIAAARAESEEKVNELQAQLDAAVIEATEAKKAYEDLVALLEETEREEAEMAAYEERKSARLEAVAAVVEFPADYTAANADRWAGMSDEDFEATLEDYKAVAAKATASADGSKDRVPAKTALQATRDTDVKGSGASAVREVMRLRSQGIDPRELTR